MKTSNDQAGRTTSVVTPSGTTNLGYDYESRITSISGPGISQTNSYNGLDTRVGSTTNAASQTFLRDGAYVTDAVLSDGSATYTPGVSERRGSTTTFSHSGLKNAEAQTSTAQTVSASKTYDAFGNLVASTGTWAGPFAYGGGFGYQEDATGLKLLGHRYYDASIGRFLTRDPIKDGRNWYTYCGNDPLGRYDGSGLNLIGTIKKIWSNVWNNKKELAGRVAAAMVDEEVKSPDIPDLPTPPPPRNNSRGEDQEQSH